MEKSNKDNLSNENSGVDKSTFFKKIDGSCLSKRRNEAIMRRAKWYLELKELPKGSNIYQASKLMGVPYTTLKLFLRDLEFCRLVRFRSEIHNGKESKVIIIEDFLGDGNNEK